MYVYLYTALHMPQVNTVAWNESGTRILSGSDDCHLKIYDSGSGLVCSVCLFKHVKQHNTYIV